MPHCTACGTAYALGTTSCGNCGATLILASDSGASPAAETASPPPSTPAKETTTTRPGGRPVVADLQAVGRAKRITAFAIDLLIVVALLGLSMKFPGGLGVVIRKGLLHKLMMFGPSVYLLLRDSLGGRSVGKLIVGLVTWDERAGRPAGLMDSVIRNWPLAALLFPLAGPLWLPLLWPVYALKVAAGLLVAAMLVQVLLGRKRRALDGMATTCVVEERWLG